MKAIVVGGGVGGLCAAAALRRTGIDAEILEAAPELRAEGSGLGILSNGIGALRALGLDLGLERRGTIVRVAEMCAPDGTVLRRHPFDADYAKIGAPTVCLSRTDLLEGLREAAEGVPITTGAAVTGFARDGSGVTAVLTDGRRVSGDILIGADGINSAIRAQVAGPAEPRYGGFVCWLATVPFDTGRFPEGLGRQYWGRGTRFGINDMGHGRFYWWGTTNTAKTEMSGGKDDLERTFAGWAPEIRELIEVTPEKEILTVPAQDRPFLDRWGDGPVTLLGDAAHPMLPSLSQGATSAIEDAVVLALSLRSAPDPETGLRLYEDRRRERTRRLVEESWTLGKQQQYTNRLLCAARTLAVRFAPLRLATPGYLDRLTFPGYD
ncbi:NAD(P)/FAD-dependent oxidoreductase [Actinocorallia lasiicapitis]